MRHLSSAGLLYCPLPPLAPSSYSGSWVSPQHSVPVSLLRRHPSEGSFPTKHSLTRYPATLPPSHPGSVFLHCTRLHLRTVCLSVGCLPHPQPPKKGGGQGMREGALAPSGRTWELPQPRVPAHQLTLRHILSIEKPKRECPEF